VSIEIARTADDKKQGMTLADLRAFLAEVDRAGIPDTSVVKAAVGFKAQLQKVGVRG
jgi:hypothetical protein